MAEPAQKTDETDTNTYGLISLELSDRLVAPPRIFDDHAKTLYAAEIQIASKDAIETPGFSIPEFQSPYYVSLDLVTNGTERFVRFHITSASQEDEVTLDVNITRLTQRAATELNLYKIRGRPSGHFNDQSRIEALDRQQKLNHNVNATTLADALQAAGFKTVDIAFAGKLWSLLRVLLPQDSAANAIKQSMYAKLA